MRWGMLDKAECVTSIIRMLLGHNFCWGGQTFSSTVNHCHLGPLSSPLWGLASWDQPSPLYVPLHFPPHHSCTSPLYLSFWCILQATSFSHLTSTAPISNHILLFPHTLRGLTLLSLIHYLYPVMLTFLCLESLFWHTITSIFISFPTTPILLLYVW